MTFETVEAIAKNDLVKCIMPDVVLDVEEVLGCNLTLKRLGKNLDARQTIQ